LSLVTFLLSRRRRKVYIGYARLCGFPVLDTERWARS